MSDSVRPHSRQPTRLPHPWDSPGKNTGGGCHFLLQCMKVKGKLLSHVRLLAIPWTAAHQAPPSMGFSRQEYWSGVPLPSPPRLSRSPVTGKNVMYHSRAIPHTCSPHNHQTHTATYWELCWPLNIFLYQCAIIMLAHVSSL